MTSKNDFSKEEIARYYQTLPDELKEFYDGTEGSDKIVDICDNYNLRIDQMGEVVKTTYHIILGLIKSEEFVPRMISRAGISEDIANLITHDINDQILKPIHLQMVEHHQKLTGAKSLPANVEKSDLGFSSTPYPQESTGSREQTDLISEIENPAPATFITRDNFWDKKNNLSASNQRFKNIDQTKVAPQKSEPQKATPTVKPKFDPYREPI